MPKYKNIGNVPETFYSVSFKPLEEKEVDFYIYHKNIKKISDDPVVLPVTFSKKIEIGETFEFSEVDLSDVSNIRLTSINSIGAFIRFNSKTTPLVFINHKYVDLRPVHKFNSIFVESGSPVIIEFWKSYSWR